MESFQLGTAIREITPAYPVWMHGYSDREHRSTGVAEPIYMGCLAVGDGRETALVITCDMIGIRTHVCQELYELLERETGIAYPHVFIACSHTHFAPALHEDGFGSPRVGIVEPDPAFVADFRTKLVEAARESIRNMRPGRLQTARLQVPQVLFNRRTVASDGLVHNSFLYPSEPGAYSSRPTDGELTVLRVVDETGVRAVLANFGCHPVTGGPVQERDHHRISADYPHYLRRAVAAHYGCPVFFTLGAAGDTVPLNRYGDSRSRIGTILANSIILAERTYSTEVAPRIRADALAIDVDTIMRIDGTIAEAELGRARARLAAVPSGTKPATDHDANTDAHKAFQHKMMAALRSRLYPNNEYAIPIQFLQIGRTILVGLPFEVLAEISLAMKRDHPSSVLVSCTGGYQGYLPLAHEYERGGYEATEQTTHFTPGTADRILDVILEQLGRWTQV